MKRKNPIKSALILTSLAALLIIISIFVIKPYQEKQNENEQKTALLFDITRDKVVDFKIENQQGLFHIKRKAENNEEWFLAHNGQNFDADKGTIDGIVSTILSAKKESSVSITDLNPFGLQQPKFRLLINEGLPNEQSEIHLGEDTPVDYFVYSKWKNKPEVFATTRSLRFSLDKSLKDLRNKKIFSTPIEQIKKIELQTLAHNNSASKLLVFDKREGSWSSTENKNPIQIDSNEIDNLLTPFRDLVVINFTSEAGTTDRAKFGFSRPIARLNLTFGENDKAPQTHQWLLAKARDAEANAEKYYFSELGREAIYEVSETFKDNFIKELAQFRPKTITNIALSDIQGLVVTDTKTTLNFTRKDSGWEVHVSSDKLNETRVGKTTEIEDAIKTIAQLKVDEFFNPNSLWPIGLQTPSRMIEIRGKNNEKENELIATLVFGKKLKEGIWSLRAEGMDSPVSTRIDLDESLPLDINRFSERPVEIQKTAPSPQAKSETLEKGKKVKLEATEKSTKDLKKLPAPITKNDKKYSAIIHLDNGNQIEIAFDAALAPYTVSNFIHLARNGFYDNVKFHRVIDDFVAQGGDPTGTGRGGPGWQFEDEANDLKHEAGVISMANAGPNTNGSQFFLVHKPQAHLNGKHTVFGKIVSGLDHMYAIKAGDSMKKVEVFEESL